MTATSPPRSAAAFLAWIEQASPSDTITYHEGHLGIDRMPGPSSLPESTRFELDRIAGHAMALAEDGCLLLVQHRLADGRLAYLAIKASDDKPRRI